MKFFFLAQTTWQLSKSDTLNELIAIACVLRNHVIPRIGQVATYSSYMEACRDFLEAFPSRKPPTLEEPVFIAPDGFLSVVDGIYDASSPDITATHDHPNGACFFCRPTQVEPGSWVDLEIIKKPAHHPLLGTWGSQQFYG